MDFIKKIGNHFGLIAKARFTNIADAEKEDDAVTKRQLDAVEASLPSEDPYNAWPFTASDYSAVGGTFVADNSDYSSRYKTLGKTLFWEGYVFGAVTGLPSELIIKLPNSYIAKNIGGGINAYVEGQLVATTIFSSNTISIRTIDGTDWANNATQYIYWNLTLEIE